MRTRNQEREEEEGLRPAKKSAEGEARHVCAGNTNFPVTLRSQNITIL
jgi:hypothetical protein